MEELNMMVIENQFTKVVIENKLTKEEMNEVFNLLDNDEELAKSVDHYLKQGGLWCEVSYQIAKEYGIVNAE